jgi:hypothetical protein
MGSGSGCHLRLEEVRSGLFFPPDPGASIALPVPPGLPPHREAHRPRKGIPVGNLFDLGTSSRCSSGRAGEVPNHLREVGLLFRFYLSNSSRITPITSLILFITSVFQNRKTR